MASKAVKEDTSLRQKFETTLRSKLDCLDGLTEATMSVYNELVRKLCNTRLAEFIDAYRQTKAAEKGSATLAGQNLRDALLSQHANLKSLDTS